MGLEAHRCLRGRREQPFGLRTMALALAVLFVGVLHTDRAPAQVGPVHALDRVIGRLETIVRHEAKALGVARVRIKHDLGRLGDAPKRREGVVQVLLVHLGGQVADKEVGPHVHGPAVLRGLVHPQGFPIHPNHVHDLDRVVRVLLGAEFDKAKALVRPRDLVPGHVDVHHRSNVLHELPQQILRHFLIKPTTIHRRVLVPLLDRARSHG